MLNHEASKNLTVDQFLYMGRWEMAIETKGSIRDLIRGLVQFTACIDVWTS